MQKMIEILSSPSWSNFIWALVHSLWIGAVCALALGLFLRKAPSDRPERRYMGGLVALASLAVGTIIAWGALQERSNRIVSLVESDPTGQIMTVASKDTGVQSSFQHVAGQPSLSSPKPPAWVAWAATLWLAGFSVMFIRLANQMVDVNRVRRTCEVLQRGTTFDIAKDLAEKLGLKKAVRVATSAVTSVPAAFGVIRPVILLPLSMTTGLPVEQIRAILAHELAHIRRHDYAINLVQQLIEAVLFFNPAVWWINRQVRNEREACCDLMAVSALENRENYAQALTDWISTGRNARKAHLQMAFPGDDKPETLLERLRRLLVPDYQPALRVPWHSFLMVICLSSLCLFTAWQGSQLAVAIAAELLSPAERIEKIAELQESHGNQIRSTPEEEIVVSGTVQTHDRKPLPRSLQIHMNVRTYQGSYGFGSVPVKEGRFEHKIKRGKIYIAAGGEGYGTAFLGPLEAPTGQSLTNIQLVLPGGYPAKMRVVDSNGNPVSNAKLTGLYQHPAGALMIRKVTDEAGEAMLANAVNQKMSWEIQAPGFQTAKFEGVILNGEFPTSWSLSPAHITSGVVVDRDSGIPLSDAAIKLIGRFPAPLLQTMPQDAEVIARTDAQGRFSLDKLVDGAKHVLVVEAPGKAPRVVYEVLAGKQNLKIEMGAEIIVSGTISGDLEQLKSWDGNYVISVVNPLKLREDSENHYSIRVPVVLEDGLGRFSIPNVREGKIIITAGKHVLEYELTKSVTNISVTIEKAEQILAKPERDVIIRFATPPGLPQVKGILKYYAISQSGGVSEPGLQVVTNNEVTIKSPVPGLVSYEMSGIIGYWAPPEHAQVTHAEKDPFVLTVHPLQAGAIYGHVLDHDGSEVSGVMISVVEAAPAPGKKSPGGLGDMGKNSASPDDGPTRFVVQPLPLGGKYRLVAHTGNRYMATEIIELTEKEPIKEIKMLLATGVTLPINVVDAKGNPIQGVAVDLNYSVVEGHSFGIASPTVSDLNGHLSFPAINPDVPGRYEAVVGSGYGGKRTSNYQPVRQAIDFKKLPVTIQLDKGLTIAGKVLNDATGNPLSGAEFFVTPVDKNEGGQYINSDEKSAADGSFDFSTLKPIDYWLGCRDGRILGGDGGGMGRIRVRGGQQNPVVVRIIPHKGVRLIENGRPILHIP